MNNKQPNSTMSVESIFQEAAGEIDSIFNSFRDLHTHYQNSFSNLEKSLDGLPLQYKGRVGNARKSFENMAKTVGIKQDEISGKLHAQALVILMGNAESITKELFRGLLRQNIRSVKFKDSVQVSLKSVLKAAEDSDLANIVLQKLESENNPTEKLNFQNMSQMKGIFKGYLNIVVEDSVTDDLHKYWQIRHSIIHNGSIIDQKFINNVRKADPGFVKNYSAGDRVVVDKSMYDECFAKLTLMFQVLDSEIERLGLNYA